MFTAFLITVYHISDKLSTIIYESKYFVAKANSQLLYVFLSLSGFAKASLPEGGGTQSVMEGDCAICK